MKDILLLCSMELIRDDVMWYKCYNNYPYRARAI